MATTWRLLNEEEARDSWDEALIRLSDHNPFQSYAWGQYRKSLGWEPCYWAAFDDAGEVVAMMLGALRRYPLGFGLIWGEGGPVGDLTVCGESFQEAIKKTTGLNRVYCRFRCDKERTVFDALRLGGQGWTRSWFSITSNFSMMLDLSQGDEKLLAGMDKIWRQNLRRSNKETLTVRQWLDPTVDEVLAVYQSMQSVKGLEEQQSREEIEEFLRHFRRNLVLYRCDDEQGELISLLGWIVSGDRAWTRLCATNEKGRQVFASYATFWGMATHCHRLGVQKCDLAGIDPINNHGGYRFKKATGATPIEYLGEWDWATSPALRWFGNWGISRRDRFRNAKKLVDKATATLVKRPVELVFARKGGESVTKGAWFRSIVSFLLISPSIALMTCKWSLIRDLKVSESVTLL